MLNLSKKYKTRNGCAVRNLKRVDCHQISGQVNDRGLDWNVCYWTHDGHPYFSDDPGQHHYDLIEIKEENPPMPTIDLSKEYTTRDGKEVKILVIDKDKILGAYKVNAPKYDWQQWAWHLNGNTDRCGLENPLDLIEKKQVHKKTYYFALATDGIRSVTKESVSYVERWKATKAIEVEITEGEFI
jgi:hypothetical protein